MGFEFDDFGSGTIVVTGVPSDIPGLDEKDFIESLVEQMKMGGKAKDTPIKDRIAKAFAKRIASQKSIKTGQQEINALIEQLFASANPSYSPSGRKTTVMLSFDELESLFEG